MLITISISARGMLLVSSDFLLFGIFFVIQITAV